MMFCLDVHLIRGFAPAKSELNFAGAVYELYYLTPKIRSPYVGNGQYSSLVIVSASSA